MTDPAEPVAATLHVTARPLFRGLNNQSSSATVTATKIVSGQDVQLNLVFT